MPPAARIADLHACPMLNPDESPHVGGPITTGFPTVLIGFMPAARISSMAICVGPPDIVVKGAPTVLIGFLPAARLGDQTMHGGVITSGCPTVLIGESGSGGFGGANTPCGASAKQAKQSRAAMQKRKISEDTGIPEKALSVTVDDQGKVEKVKIDMNAKVDGPIRLKPGATIDAPQIQIVGDSRGRLIDN
jgi:uncharacterized Zn-binding protein involved in type VI secretion